MVRSPASGVRSLVAVVATNERRCENEKESGAVSDVRRKDPGLRTPDPGRLPGPNKHTDAGNVDDAKTVVVVLHCVVRARCVGVVRWIMGSAVKGG
jgi:hypothetical protein